MPEGVIQVTRLPETGGDDKGKVIHAIYVLKGDELQLRVPKHFRANKAKGDGLLFILKREKK